MLGLWVCDDGEVNGDNDSSRLTGDETSFGGFFGGGGGLRFSCSDVEIIIQCPLPADLCAKILKNLVSWLNCWVVRCAETVGTGGYLKAPLLNSCARNTRVRALLQAAPPIGGTSEPVLLEAGKGGRLGPFLRVKATPHPPCSKPEQCSHQLLSRKNGAL